MLLLRCMIACECSLCKITILISDYKKFSATQIITTTMRGVWLSTTLILLAALMTCVLQNTLKMAKLSPTCSFPNLPLLAVKKVKNIEVTSISSKCLGKLAFVANLYWNLYWNPFFNGVKRLAVNFPQHFSNLNLDDV